MHVSASSQGVATAGRRNEVSERERKKESRREGYLAMKLRAFFFSSMLIVPHCKWNVQLNQIDFLMSAN